MSGNKGLAMTFTHFSSRGAQAPWRSGSGWERQLDCHASLAMTGRAAKDGKRESQDRQVESEAYLRMPRAIKTK